MSNPFDISGVTTAANADDDAKKAGAGLESFFLRQVLAEVRSSSEGSLLDGGFAGSTFHEMLDGALADSMAKNGGLGIGKMVEKALTKSADDDPSDAPIKVLQARSK